MAISTDLTELGGYVRTTSAAFTDVPGLAWVIADKSVEVYTLDAIAIRENSSFPSVAYSNLKRYLASMTGAGTVTVATGAQIAELNDAGGAYDIQMVAVAGGSVKVQVKGDVSASMNWYVFAKRRVLISN